MKKILNHCSFQLVSINISKIHTHYIDLWVGRGHILAILGCFMRVAAVPLVEEQLLEQGWCTTLAMVIASVL